MKSEKTSDKKLGAMAVSTITMTMVNPVAPGEPIVTIFTGVAAVLNVSLLNGTGGDILMNSGAAPSSLEIFMPYYFSTLQVSAMSITGVSQHGWETAYSSADNSLTLTWKGEQGKWAQGSLLSFTIAGILSNSQTGSDDVQINYSNLGGHNIPGQTSVNLTLSVPPQPGNANLADTLEIATEYGGAVFVSTPDNPLSNTLYLNFKNINRDTPLYSGNRHWPGTPKITVSFVYGNTSGALAPDDKSGSLQQGSAWGIAGSVYVDQTGGWSVQNPNPTGSANAPSWVFSPVVTNGNIIGVQDHANVTFAFNNIVSFTPYGATQVYVHFTGFMRDDNTPYSDAWFVVPIDKLNAPNPGVLGIWSMADKVTVHHTKDEVSIPFKWTMFGVGGVRLLFDFPGMKIPSQDIPYGSSHPALYSDTRNIILKNIPMSGKLTVYCIAYSDSRYQYKLNKIECSVPVDFPPIINSFTIEAIEIVPPASSAFRLSWDIEGAQRFQITADDGSNNPHALQVPDNVSTFVVSPVIPCTVYTLNVFGPNPSN